jgi:hypothetical protein
MAFLYKAFNGPSPTTAALAKVTTGTAIKTLMQIATPSTESLRIVEWGISFDGSAAATPIEVELIDTNVAATVTAFVAADIVKLNAPNDVGTLMTLGTAASGYTSTAEGTITSARLLDYQLIAPTGQYIIQYPLGREPAVAASRFLRIRVTAPAAVNAVAYICWEE